MIYPHWFSQIKGEEWRTQKIVRDLLAKHFTNTTGGIPGNDDTGTMSAWAVLNMIGFYPHCPGKPEYTITAPVFDKVTIHLDPLFYNKDKIILQSNRTNADEYKIKSLTINEKEIKRFIISHDELINAGTITYNF